jgi:SAM-dependent methyltransferase
MSVSGRVESDYYSYRNFDSELNKRGRRYYLRYFERGPVLELACGRGEFLELLAEAGIEGRGVDSDAGMVEHCTGRGLTVEYGDALEHLAGGPDGTLAGVFCAHFLEHLPSQTVQRLFVDVARVLAPGGTFVAAVPNAACLSVAGHDFWRDPTHVRYYDPVLLEFFADRAGLVPVGSGGNPDNDAGPPPHLYPPEFAPEPPLGAELAATIQRAQRLYPERRRGRDAATKQDLWMRLGHLVHRLDVQLQATRHDLYQLRSAYVRLLTQLYPANEVYVVSRKPESGSR